MQQNQIQGVGTDIIEVGRIKDAIARHKGRFLDRIFTQKEQEYCSKFSNATIHYAGRFAAKEAVVKALGTGLTFEMTWCDLEIINNTSGQPEVFVSQRVRQTFPTAHFFLSISHCNDYATATAIVTK